ncbi:MAG: hypothetical protein ABEK36_05610 [Candidatus Aenigmatarchaeota archaeon]
MVEMYILGLAFLLAPVLAEYANLKEKTGTAFGWIAGAGLFFLLSSTFENTFWSVVSTQASYWGSLLFQFFGWIFAFIGTIWAAYLITKEE